MYSKLLIWSTINTESAICKTWQIFLPCLPSDRQRRQPRFHRTWDFRAFSRGRCEDCSLALSLRKTSGIFDGDLLLSPEAYLLLTCHNVASAFFRLQESVKWSPQGTALQGFVKLEDIRLLSGKEHGLSAAALLRGHSPAARTSSSPGSARRSPGLRGSLCGVTQPHTFQRSFWQSFLMKWNTMGFLIESRLENWVPRLLFAERTKTYNLLFPSRKTQFVVLRRFLHSAEPNVSADRLLCGQTGTTARFHRPFFLNTKNISKVQRPVKHALAWGKQCKEKGVLLKGKLIKIGRNLWPFSQDALKCHEMKKHASKCHVILTLVTITSLHPTQKKRHF